jgi:hypothetical protein
MNQAIQWILTGSDSNFNSTGHFNTISLRRTNGDCLVLHYMNYESDECWIGFHVSTKRKKLGFYVKKIFVHPKTSLPYCVDEVSIMDSLSQK